MIASFSRPWKPSTVLISTFASDSSAARRSRSTPTCAEYGVMTRRPKGPPLRIESVDAPAPSSPPPRPGYPCCLPLLRSVPPCHTRPCPRARVLGAVSDPHRKKNRRSANRSPPRRLRGLDARRLARATSFPSYISSLAHRMIRSFIRYCTVSIFATPMAFHLACARAKSVSEPRSRRLVAHHRRGEAAGDPRRGLLFSRGASRPNTPPRAPAPPRRSPPRRTIRREARSSTRRRACSTPRWRP